MKAHVKLGKAGLKSQMMITVWECVDRNWLNLLCKLAGAGLSRGSSGGFASIPIHVGVLEGWSLWEVHCLCAEAYKAVQLFLLLWGHHSISWWSAALNCASYTFNIEKQKVLENKVSIVVRNCCYFLLKTVVPLAFTFYTCLPFFLATSGTNHNYVKLIC